MNYETYLLKKYGYKKTTIHTKIKSLDLYKKSVSKHVTFEEIETEELLKIVEIQKNKYSLNVLNQHFKVLEDYFYYLMEIGKREHHPLENFRIKTKDKKIIRGLFREKELEDLYKRYPKNGHYFGIFDVYQSRNRVILGMLIYQGLSSKDVQNLEVESVNLETGKVHILSKKGERLNSRILRLESIQIIELQEYINQTRKELLNLIKAKKETKKMFPVGERTKFSSVLQSVKRQLNKYEKIENLQIIRNSRIGIWMERYNVREVQYLAGYKSLLSLEKFNQSKLEKLKNALEKLHPSSK